jgi:hypothetical protein
MKGPFPVSGGGKFSFAKPFRPDYTVWCTGQDITANFSGSPALLGEFYAILQGATPAVDPIQISKQ